MAKASSATVMTRAFPPPTAAGTRTVADASSATYRVTFDRLGAKTPIDGASLRVTLVAEGKAIEQVVPID